MGVPKTPDAETRRFLDRTNWDPALRTINIGYDRLSEAMRGKDRSTRLGLYQSLVTEMEKRVAEVRPRGPLGRLALVGDDSAKAKAIGDILVGMLTSAMNQVQRASDRNEQSQHNLRLAFALAAYKRQHDSYPKTLAVLTPDYLPSIPDDLFSGKPLIYRPSKDGYLLYSVGLNGKDDEGRSADDDPGGDDLTIRMPLPKPGGK